MFPGELSSQVARACNLKLATFVPRQRNVQKIASAPNFFINEDVGRKDSHV